MFIDNLVVRLQLVCFAFRLAFACFRFLSLAFGLRCSYVRIICRLPLVCVFSAKLSRKWCFCWIFGRKVMTYCLFKPQNLNILCAFDDLAMCASLCLSIVLCYAGQRPLLCLSLILSYACLYHILSLPWVIYYVFGCQKEMLFALAGGMEAINSDISILCQIFSVLWLCRFSWKIPCFCIFMKARFHPFALQRYSVTAKILSIHTPKKTLYIYIYI